MFNHRIAGFVVLGSLAGALTAVNVAGADWPQFCGSTSRNMIASEKNLPESFVPGEKDSATGRIVLSTATNVQWGVRIGSVAYSSPTIVGERIFIGSGESGKGLFKCLDRQSGRLIWQYSAPYRKFPAEVEAGKKFMLGRITPNLGICSTATVDGDNVYFVNHRCEVLCLDARGGTNAIPVASTEPSKSAGAAPSAEPGARSERLVWSFDMWDYGIRPSDACNGSPLVDGDLLYVTTSNGVDREAELAAGDGRQPPAPKAPNLIVLDKRTGRLVATDDVEQIGPNLLHGQWSTPSMGIVNGRKLIFYGGGDGVCYAFEALASVPEKPVKLKTVWSFDCNPPEYKEFGGMSRELRYALGDKRVKQSLNRSSESSYTGMSEIIGCPVFFENRVYVTIGRDPEHGRGRGALWCIDATQSGDITRTGKVWGYQGLDRSISTSSISDGLLYIGDIAGRLHCLDLKSGQPCWVHETNETIWSSTLVADNKVYLSTTKHFWVLAAGREKKVISEISLGAPIYASPVALDGTLFINSRTYLWSLHR